MFTVETPLGPVELEVEALDLPPTFPIILPICRALGIVEIVDRLCPMHHQGPLTHGQVLEMLVLHILQDPDRKPLYKLQEWAADHHVNQLYDCDPEAFNDDRVGRALEAFAEQIPAIEAEIVTRALEGFNVPIDAIHWDLTHVTFTGAYEDFSDVGPGYGDGQMHEKQLQISLHATHEGGIPLRHEVLAGSAAQAPLVPPMLADLRRRLPPSKLLIVSDCSGISYDNIVTYNQADACFLGPMEVTPAEQQFVADLSAEAFVPLSYQSKNNPDCVYSCHDTTLTVKRQKRPQPLTVRALVIHSTSRQQRDARLRQKAVDKALKRLQQIAGYLNKARYAHESFAREQLAKAVPQGLVGIVHHELTGSYKQMQLRSWVDEEALAAAGPADGRWLLVTNDGERSADELFKIQRGQYDLEARFRNLGHDLAVHPVWLHKETRIRGLMQAFIIALTVYCLLELCSVRAKLEGDHYPKMTARQLLYHFSSAKIVRVRTPGYPPRTQLVLSLDQKHILNQLGFPDPTQYVLSPLTNARDAPPPR